MEYNRNQNKSRNDRGDRGNREGAKKPRFAQGGPERGDKPRREERKADAKPYAKNNAKPYRKPTGKPTEKPIAKPIAKPTVEAEAETATVPAEGIHGDYENGAVIGRGYQGDPSAPERDEHCAVPPREGLSGDEIRRFVRVCDLCVLRAFGVCVCG